ncbi:MULTISPECIES: nucleotidyltransferase family protein [Shewanella]|uniref:nucleotidyltransferase family protein n=1 Tax=Shewanella TaxID=22 RepID=UPI00201A29B4|nr:nucleotidyltransferase family protein [Shewanella sp. 10B]
MTETELAALLRTWLSQDRGRMRALELAQQCAQVHSLPQWCLAAGFVRNLVWDKLHDIKSRPLNDIDLIYYCPLDTRPERDRAIEAYLQTLAPDLPWSVKNQARMHLNNQDNPYQSTQDAMCYWPEQETAVAVYLEHMPNTESSVVDNLQLIAPFGLSSLFALQLTHNPKRALAVFEQRIATKNWLKQYPRLSLANDLS